jgi:S-(hydroxymethyl)glutathione dehydrogenase/alcohol dehydrogenase
VKAAVMHEPGRLAIEDLVIDEPWPHEVRIRVAASGVCHSDLSYVQAAYPSPLPIVLGHEGAGVVEAVGEDVTYVAPGDRVVTCVSLFCGRCRQCLLGRPNLCTDRPRRPDGAPPRLALDGREVHQLRELGSFAEEMLVHENSLAKVPTEMDLDVACLLGCAVVTGAGAVFTSAAVRGGSTVAVIGCGGVGLNVVQAARLAGAARIIAVDRLESKLELARAFGATDVVDAARRDAVAAVLELTDGGVDYSFEVIGRPATAQQAVEMLALGGTATIVGVMGAEDSFAVKAWTLLRDRKVQGCTMGSNRFRLDIPMLADLYLDGRLELDALISERMPLEGLEAAFDAMHGGRAARTVLLLNEALAASTTAVAG